MLDEILCNPKTYYTHKDAKYLYVHMKYLEYIPIENDKKKNKKKYSK